MQVRRGPGGKSIYRELKALKCGYGEGCLISKMDRFQNERDQIDEKRQILKRIKGTKTSLVQAQSQVQHTFENITKKNKCFGKRTS